MMGRLVMGTNMNIDKFEELYYSYRCGNIKATKEAIKKLSRADRGLVIRWCHADNYETAIKWSLWIIEGEL